MPHSLPSSIPGWVAPYIGLPFESRGRSRGGLDCWGLVRLVYAERFGVMLPSYLELYEGVDDSEGIAGIFARDVGEQADWRPVPVDEISVGDVATFTVGHQLRHVGLVIGAERMLHAHAGTDSCVERWTSPIWGKRLAGFVRFTGPVQVRGFLNALRPARIDAAVPEGLTLTEIVRVAGVPATPAVRAFVGGVSVPFEAWGRVRPKAGRMVTLACVPEGGGGKNPLRTIAMLAVIAAAAAIPGAALAAGALGVAATSTAATMAGSLIIAGAGLVGTLLVNALIPPPKPRLSDLSGAAASNSIAGGRNTIALFQPVPRVLGVHRIVPPYAALPYTENVGDDQYLRVLFDLGPGPLDISEHQIGDTSLEEFEGVEIEVRGGRPDDPPITLYPGVVLEESLSVLLTNNGSWVTRTTSERAREISIDVTFATGLAEISGSGRRRNRTVSLEIEYAPTGTSAWVQVNEASPEDERQLDLLFRTPEAEAIGTGIHEGAIEWGAGFAGDVPADLPSGNWSWEASGLLFVPASGEYTFAIDCSDAGDVTVDDQVVASWYGTHATAGSGTPDYSGHTGTITLTRGAHRFRARVESRGAAGAIAVGWKKPGDVAFETIPASRLSRFPWAPSEDLRTRSFDTSAYGGSLVIEEARTEPFRRSLAWAVPEGQYDVRIRRLTPDTDETDVVDEVHWTALRTIRSENPVNTTGHALVAMRIKATDQLNGVIEDYSCLAQSILPDWDAAAGAWVEQGTSNPASLFRAVLQSAGNARPVGDDRLDLTELQAWHEACTANAWAFNAVIDTAGTVWERLADIASAGRASPAVREGLFSIVRDVEQTVPVQHFTPRNSSGFKGRRSFPTLPHALRVRFLNEDEGYQQDERIVYADGQDATTATRFETLELYGVTSADQAWKHGRYHLAAGLLRPETYELTTDVEHLVCTRGDLVLVTHDVVSWGLGQARVSDLVVDSADNLLGLVLDAEVPMAAGEDYAVRVRLEDGSSWTRSVVAEAGAQTELTLSTLVGAGETRPQVGDLVLFGRAGQESRELVVRAVTPGPDLSATLMLVDHAPAIHLADQGDIPAWDSGISRPPRYSNRPERPVIESIRSDDGVMIREPDGSLRDRMLITLRMPTGTGPIVTHAQVRIRRKPSPPAEPKGPFRHLPLIPIDAGQVSIEEVETGVTYQIRLRTVTELGKTSKWVTAEHTVQGKTTPPPDVESFEAFRLADGTRRFAWVMASDPDEVPRDLAGFRVKYGPVGYSWAQLTDIADGLWQSSPTDAIEPPAGEWQIGIKAVDTSGNESRNATFVTIDLGEPPLPGAAFSLDERVAGWPGTKTGCTVGGDGGLEAIDVATWATLADYLITSWDAWNRWVVSPTSPIVYESQALDAGAVIAFAPDCLATGLGDLTVELAWSTDGVTYTDWAEVSGVRVREVTARYLKARVTCVQSGAGQVPRIATCLLLMRAQTAEHEHQDLDTSSLGGAYLIGPGDVRLPLPAGEFSLIRAVSLAFNGAGAGWTWELVDRDVTVGPRVRLYDSTGTPAHAVVDALIRGLP